MDTTDSVGEDDDSQHIYSKNLSVSSAHVNPLFSNMSKRAWESFATSACAKQKATHCSAMMARKIDDKNADIDFHALHPPEYQAGVDPKRENLCQKDSERVTSTTTGASSSWQQDVAGASSCQVKRTFIFIQMLMGPLSVAFWSQFTSDCLRESSWRTKHQEDCRLNAMNEVFQGRKIWYSPYNDEWKHWSIAKTHTTCKILKDWISRKIDQDESSRVLRFYIVCWSLECRSKMDLSSNWIRKLEKGGSSGTYYQVLLPVKSKSRLERTDSRILRSRDHIHVYVQRYRNLFATMPKKWQRFAIQFKPGHWCFLGTCVRKYVVERIFQRTSRKCGQCLQVNRVKTMWVMIRCTSSGCMGPATKSLSSCRIGRWQRWHWAAT